MYAPIVDTIWLYEESDTWYNTEFWNTAAKGAAGCSI